MHTCGEFGGITKDGEPCGKTVGEKGTRCRWHKVAPRREVEKLEHAGVCGDFGGMTRHGEPCQHKVQTKTRCWRHDPEQLARVRARRNGDDDPSLLTDQEDRFVQHYLISMNVPQSARKAGYAESIANGTAYSWVRNPDFKPRVYKAIQAGKKARARRMEVTADRVLQELARIAFFNLGEIADWDEDSMRFIPKEDLTAEQTAAMSAVKSKRTSTVNEDGTVTERNELEIKLHDKIQAMREMAKHLGVADHVRVSGSIEIRMKEMSDEELVEELRAGTNRLQALGFLPAGAGTDSLPTSPSEN